jgi:hypothetical protein
MELWSGNDGAVMQRILMVLALLAGSTAAVSNPPRAGIADSSSCQGPTANSCAAASATVAQNSLCAASTTENNAGLPISNGAGLGAFYWEIGNSATVLLSGSVSYGGKNPDADDYLEFTSSSKWIYGTYYLQYINGSSNLQSYDIAALHQTDGYVNGENNCPLLDTVSECSSRTPGKDKVNPGNYQVPACTGIFCYDGEHFNNHGATYADLGPDRTRPLNRTVFEALGQTTSDTTIEYWQVDLAGGVNGTPAAYRSILQGILAGTLKMNAALFAYAVPTLPTHASRVSETYCGLNDRRHFSDTYGSTQAGCTPIPEPWSYSISHWIENQTACVGSTGTLVPCTGDGAASSPGSNGFYPWIDSSATYYGVLARYVDSAGVGFQSVQCGRLIRKAFLTGVTQSGYF